MVPEALPVAGLSAMLEEPTQGKGEGFPPALSSDVLLDFRKATGSPKVSITSSVTRWEWRLEDVRILGCCQENSPSPKSGNLRNAEKHEKIKTTPHADISNNPC